MDSQRLHPIPQGGKARHGQRIAPDPSAHGKGMAAVIYAISQRPAEGMSYENHQRLPAPAAPRQLRLLCLLVSSASAPARYLPVHTMRPMPPRVCAADSRPKDGQGCWRVDSASLELVDNTGLYLRETRAVAPSTEVLARCAGHRQANAICATSGVTA